MGFRGLAFVAGAAALIAACATSGAPPWVRAPKTACEVAFQNAALIDATADKVEDLNPAVRACPTLADWVAAAARYPEALDGVDPKDFLRNRCQYGDGLSETALCAALP